MDINELKQRLGELGVRNKFSVRNIAQPEMRPDDVTVIEPEASGKGWTVYYTERGSVFDKCFFQNEHEACEYVMEIATRPKTPVVKRSDEEERKARAKAEELAKIRLAEFKQRSKEKDS